jgi:hypothetical protein
MDQYKANHMLFGFRPRCCCFLLLDFHRITVVEEHIDRDSTPQLCPVDGATEAENLLCKEPPNQIYRVSSLVVGGDCSINEFKRGIRIAEHNDRDVDIRSFLNGLVLNPRICNNDDSGFFEGACNVVIGEVSGGESSGNSSLSTGSGGVFEDSAVTIWSGGDDTNIAVIRDSSNDASC